MRWDRTKREAFRELSTNRTVQKRLAKFMAQQCFRNSYIEHIHAGIIPYSKKGDFSDVMVKTPYGDVPWCKVSRITGKEMMKLNKEVADKCLTFLMALFHKPEEFAQGFKNADFVPYWDDPKPRPTRKS